FFGQELDVVAGVCSILGLVVLGLRLGCRLGVLVLEERGPNTPREIKRMASKAKSSSSARSVLFEDWLQSNECWKHSKLLARLRNRSSTSRRGMRRWLFYNEMIARFGEEVAAAIKETKESDPERSLTEIRKWPECEDYLQYKCLVEENEESCDEEEFEEILELQAMSPEELEAHKIEQEKKSKATKALQKATERVKTATKISQETSVSGMSDKKVQEARAALQGAVDREVRGPSQYKAQPKILTPIDASMQLIDLEALDDLTSSVTASCDQFDKINKDFQSRKAGKDAGSDDDHTGDAANGLLQNILERAETVGSAMVNARASYEESGRYFKGKIMSGLVNYRPGNDSRDFFKKEPTQVPAPIYEGFEGHRKEVMTTIPVLDPHEVLDYLQTELKLECPRDKTQQYWKHLQDHGNPFALQIGSNDCYVPFTIYGDELTLGKDSKDKVTGVFLQLTLFKPRAARQGMWLLCAIQDSVMVHADMKTLQPVLDHIVWSCNVASDGRYPHVASDGSPLTGGKALKAGMPFFNGSRFVCAELRGDWKWHASDSPLRYYDIQAVHGYYLTTKAYNARIVMLWLANKCQQAALN
ncbi:unnamed protein product, partial [Symbiodinium sp. KB8]